jgi:hypothetical protein
MDDDEEDMGQQGSSEESRRGKQDR